MPLLHETTKQAVVAIIGMNDGSMPAEDLLNCFHCQLKNNGFINRPAYDEFVAIVESVAIKHESETFGRTWILRKPPSRRLGQ